MILQMSGALIGIVGFAVAAKTDAERWRAWAWPLLLASIVLLLIPVLAGARPHRAARERFAALGSASASPSSRRSSRSLR